MGTFLGSPGFLDVLGVGFLGWVFCGVWLVFLLCVCVVVFVGVVVLGVWFFCCVGLVGFVGGVFLGFFGGLFVCVGGFVFGLVFCGFGCFFFVFCCGV
ncbi:hypothetical protein, partial [Staphylococcus aureus]|uniref:hypothetical protein n=1 Tax=Staphylococcus aureus TaxID=1280 RepID=UPI002899FDBA